MFLKLKLKGSELKIEAPKKIKTMDALSMDHPCGRGSWTTPVDLVHGPPLVDTVHRPSLWTSSMDPRSWTRCMEYFCGPPQMFEDEFY